MILNHISVLFSTNFPYLNKRKPLSIVHNHEAVQLSTLTWTHPYPFLRESSNINTFLNFVFYTPRYLLSKEITPPLNNIPTNSIHVPMAALPIGTAQAVVGQIAKPPSPTPSPIQGKSMMTAIYMSSHDEESLEAPSTYLPLASSKKEKREKRKEKRVKRKRKEKKKRRKEEKKKRRKEEKEKRRKKRKNEKNGTQAREFHTRGIQYCGRKYSLLQYLLQLEETVSESTDAAATDVDVAIRTAVLSIAFLIRLSARHRYQQHEDPLPLRCSPRWGQSPWRYPAVGDVSGHRLWGAWSGEPQVQSTPSDSTPTAE